MAVLSAQQIGRTGLDPAYVAADVAGDQFANSGREFLHVKNGDTVSHTVTAAIQRTVDGQPVTDRVVTVPNAEERMIGPFPAGDYNDSGGLLSVTYDDVTSVTVGVFRV